VGEWLVDESAPLGNGQSARVLRARRVRPQMEGVVEHRAVKIYHAQGSADQRRRALEEIRVQEHLFGCPYAVAYVDAFVAEKGPFAGCVVQVMELGDRSLGAHLLARGALPVGLLPRRYLPGTRSSGARNFPQKWSSPSVPETGV